MQQSEEAPAVEDQTPSGDHGEMTFEEAMRAVAESHTPDTAEDAPESPETPEEVSATPAEPTETEAVTEPPVESEETPAESRSLARIMERESALQSKQDAYDSAQGELAELRSRLDRYEGAQQSFTQDPISFIRSLAPEGTDLKRLAEGLWNDNLGDKAPAEYLQQKAATRQYSEQGARLAKLEQAEQERIQRTNQDAAQLESQKAEAQYLGALATFAESADTGTFPLTAMMQAKDSQTVANAMESIARNHVQATNGQILQPEQVAQELERQLSHYQLRAEPVKAAAPTPEPGASLRNSSTQTQPDRASDDELSDEFLRAKAMEAVNAARQ